MKPLTGYHPKDFADDLYQILTELNWTSINLVGHSMGGRNALYFSYLYPHLLKSLVVEDISPVGEPGDLHYYQKMLGVIPTPFSSKSDVTSYFESQFVQDFASKDSAKSLVPFLMANIEEKSDGTFDWKFFKDGIFAAVEQGRSEDLWPLVDKISVPTLYMRGGNSKYLPKSVFEQVLAKNSLITGVEISDAGHWIHSDQPEAFTKNLESFLDGINH